MGVQNVYIKGVLRLILDEFEQADNHINPDKGLVLYNIYNSKDSKVLIGCKVEMNYIVKIKWLCKWQYQRGLIFKCLQKIV